MKAFKKIATLALAGLLTLSCFASCGKTSYTAENTEYFIGGTGPLTGDNSSYGVSVKNGAELAVEQINANGGLNGVLFKFDIKDDKATAADAATGYDALYEAGMQVSIGSVTSGSCESFASKSVEDNLFFITPSASAANVIENRSNAFRVCFGDPDQGTLAAERLTAQYSNIGVIYDTSDAYSYGIYEAFKAKMAELNVEFKTQSFDAENKKDFSTQAEALKDCDVIFLPIYYTEASLIAKAVASKGSDAPLFGCDGLDGLADLLDGTVSNSITYITPFDVNSSDATVSAFVEAYRAKYGSDPDQFAADGYDAIMVIYEAMKTAGIDDVTIEPSALCEKLVAVLTDPSFSFTGATGSMTWDASGACAKTPQIVVLQ